MMMCAVGLVLCWNVCVGESIEARWGSGMPSHHFKQDGGFLISVKTQTLGYGVRAT